MEVKTIKGFLEVSWLMVEQRLESSYDGCSKHIPLPLSKSQVSEEQVGEKRRVSWDEAFFSHTILLEIAREKASGELRC